MKLIWALRSFVFLAWMVLTVIPWAIAVLILSVFASSTTIYWSCANWLKVAIGGMKFFCGVRVQLHGVENVPTAAQGNASVILASKHQSTLETFLYPAVMPHPLAYVFKRELLYVPFFGWAMARMDMIHIDRSKRAEAWAKVAEQGRRLAREGVWVIMFPEGTRIPRGQAGNYKSGATRLAVETGVPIVPIAVNSARCWPRKSFLVRPGVVDVVIGPPISPQGREPDEMMREVRDWIEAQMRRIDPEAYTSA